MKQHSTFAIHKVTPSTVFLIDENKGPSVTNDAENVVSIVNALYPDRQIIYRDSQGRWDELLHLAGTFVGFAAYDGPVPA